MKLSLSTEWLFFHLWKKNPDTNQSCPGVFLADTIIYRWAQPYFWYFTTRDGQILRKTKERIFVDHIAEVFLKGQNQVSALYMQASEKQQGKTGQQEKIEFEYFQNESFNNFLYQREKSLNALLQKFIEPKNNHNSMIKVSWSPQFCLLSRKTNINDLKNTKIPLQDRLMTFEGPEHLTQSDSISSPILSSDIEQICLNIVKHIQEVSGGNIQISRMILYFKIDEKNRLWLLFSSGIKVRQKFVNEEMVLEDEKNKGKHQKQDRIMSPILVLGQRKEVQVTQTKYQHKVRNFQGFLSMQNQEDKCYNCSLNRIEVYDISLGQIIQSYEAGILDEESKLIIQKLDQDIQNAKLKKDKKDDQLQMEENEDDYYIEQSRKIPGIILKLWGKMDQEKYQSLKSNPSWLKFKIKVCMDCFMLFSVTQVESQNEREMKVVTAQIKENTRKQQWQIVKTQQKTENKSVPNKNAEQTQTNQNSNQSKPIKIAKIKSLNFKQDQIENMSTERQQFFQNTEQQQFGIGFLTDRSPVFPQIDDPYKTVQHNRFPSKKVKQVYNHRQGLKQMPKTQSMSLCSTQISQCSTMYMIFQCDLISKHKTRMESIKELKQILADNEI